MIREKYDNLNNKRHAIHTVYNNKYYNAIPILDLGGG